MAKQKVDSEERGFQDSWEAEYLFTSISGKNQFALFVELAGLYSRNTT